MDTSDRRGALLALVLVLGILAVATGYVPLLLWCVAIGALAGGLAMWSRHVWKRLDLTAWFTPGRAFSGEQVTLHVRVSNRKRLPLPLVRLSVWLPAGLRPSGPRGPHGHTIRGFQRELYVPGRSEVVLALPVQVRRRGESWLEKIVVEASDPFGMAPVTKEFAPEADLLVMPEPRIGIPVQVLRRLPFGAPARTARVFEERERFAGVRPYEPGDPLNRIHWKLTGHSAGLQVKLFEPTRTADVGLMPT